MSTYVPAKVSTQYIFFVSLVSQANTKLMQVNPTLQAADFNVSIDGGTLNALGTTPTVTPAGGRMVKITLSTSEMAGANATVVCSDNAGAEWCDLTVNIQTSTRQIDDLAYPATSGRSLAVDANGVVDARLADAVSHGGTLGSSTATLALSRMNVTSQTSNTVALTVTGNGTGSGIVATSGAGATGDGIQATSGATNGNGLVATGVGTGNGLKIVSASGDALSAVAATSGHGATFTGAGTTKHGVNATGGATTSHGISATGGGVGHGILATSGGGTTGDGIKGVAASTNGNGMNLVAIGTGDGLLATGGASAGGDGIQATAGGGVDIRGAITGNITGNLSGSVGSVTGSVGSVTGAVGSVTARVTANTDQWAGGTIPATNVTGVPLVDLKYTLGTISPATAGSVRADAVTGAVGSVTGSVGSVTGAVGSVTGNVGGNVVGSVASVTAAVAITSNIKKNQALANFEFLMTDSTNHNPVTGKTVTCTRSIDGGAFAGGTLANVNEVAVGMYRVDFGAGDLNGNVIILRATATGSDDTFERVVTQP